MTFSNDEIYTLQIAREQFAKAWLEGWQAAAFGLDYSDLGDDPAEDEVNDATEERYHCGTCTVNYVGEKLEPALLDYLRILETACGLDSRGN